ncbi:Lrp/AsnC family transcriptional regulator [Allorhizobium sp. BGMRC 0089]|uniref:Lrp/AsnC family transcriptional regulator n=1 Tax=Allorhizobium sonneratiae TaxID=2934936 RepID=UPI00203461A7|nr:Lrp/AsnC family transcriptional regulator [Allorhizobium sonneratiae]MCM2293272.1 Lrp/AsnC family transcriptional regulator [Allorhizobium sonneratiae]
MRGLDSIDRNIIRQLQLNARISNKDLAEAVGLSPSACLRRLTSIEKQGYIRGYTALLGQGEDNDGITVIINITLERQAEDYLSRFEAAIRKFPEIQECFLMAGGLDYMLRIELDSAHEFERVHKDILSKLPGVARIQSSFSIRNVLKARP